MKNNGWDDNSDGFSRPLLIILIVLGVIAVGLGGYMLGKDQGETDAKAVYDQQLLQAQSEQNAKNAGVGNAINEGLEEGQEAAAEGQATVESLQAENAELKGTIEEQKDKIADLEHQLEDAQNGEHTEDTTPQ